MNQIRLRLVSILTVLLGATSGGAEICVFPTVPDRCDGADCVTEFESASDSGVGASADVDLPNRRARARSNNGVGQRSATASVGVRLVPLETLSATITLVASYNGTLQGGAAPTSFGRVRAWAGVRNLTDDDVVVETPILDEVENSANVTVLPQAALDMLSADLEATLVEGNEYAAYVRVEARSRGLTSQSNFFTGNHGVFLESLEISSTASLADSDGDGLFDDWENFGVLDCDGQMVLDLPALGATSDHKDIFVEYDWLPGREPLQSAMRAVKAAFALAPSDAGGVTNPDGQDGIRVWIDTGDYADPNGAEDGALFGTCGDGIDNGGDGVADGADDDCLAGDNLGGGGEIDLTDVPNGVSIPRLGGDTDGNSVADFYDVKALYFDPSRRFAFHYVIGGPQGSSEGGAGAGSCSDGVDNDGDLLIDRDDSLDCFQGGQGEMGGNDFILMVTGPGIFMHELGHNLNLDHGGPDDKTSAGPTNDDINCKPNYVSVMNYNFQNGIPQDTIGGQDLDGDNVPDNLIIDYSPPRFPGGRGFAPLATLDENDLDETQVLDANDGENMTVFLDASAATGTAGLDAGIDWDGMSGATSTSVQVNVTAGPASGCSGNPAGQTLGGADDWSNIEMDFRQFGAAEDGPVNPVDEPEPGDQELEDLLEAIYTTDLAITKTVEPDPVAAGQQVTIQLLVENLGPNHTPRVQVTDVLPDGLETVALPDGCTEAPAGTVVCDLGRLRSGESETFELETRVRLDHECPPGEQFADLSNTALVANLAGGDPVSANNASTARLRVLCVDYQYVAKFVCGRQQNPETLRLLPGRYATMVNVHNPNDEEIWFFKKLALAFPPAEQRAGEVLPIGLDPLRYDESLKVDCDDLRQRLFDGEFAEGYIEGQLVVQSARSLDVQAVYTAGPLGTPGQPGGVATIDVEQIPEREFLPPELPDLVPVPTLPTDGTEGHPGGFYCVAEGQGGTSTRIRVRVHNQGDATAAASLTRVEFENGGTGQAGTMELAPGASQVHEFRIPTVCFSSFHSTCEFRITVDAAATVEESDEDNNVVESFCLAAAG